MAKAIRSFLSALFDRPGSTPRMRKYEFSEAHYGEYQLVEEEFSVKASTFKGKSCVYWGQLPDGAEIAVKRFNVELVKDIEAFCEEARFLAQFRHKNLLWVRGYCAEGCERMLVFDFIKNSSLFAHLHGDTQDQGHLNWERRMAIAIGCAEGLAYLHHLATPQLVHGDIKSTNILLKSNFEPCLVDFGMSRLLKSNVPKSRGAEGYIAPEDYKGEEELSKRSDVFSFGILLLELISGKNPAEKILGDTGKMSFVEWAQSMIVNCKYADLIDPRLNHEYNSKELEMLLNTAIVCAQERPENRFSMLDILKLLTRGPPERLEGFQYCQENQANL